MIKTPILSLGNGVTVVAMYPDGVTGAVLVSLSDGRILMVDELTMIGYLTGDRILSAQTMDGFGSISAVGSTSVLYSLHNRVIEINKSKEQVRWKEVIEPFSAASIGKAIGVFTSPVMWGGHDFGFWKGLYCDRSTPDGTSVSVYARAGTNQNSILSNEWLDMTPGTNEINNLEIASSSSSMGSHESVTMFKSLDGFNSKGSYLQLKLVLGTSESGSRPVVVKLTASYETKYSVYFFTQKFILKQGSNASDLFLSGTYSMPQGTEIKFGVSPSGSSDWNNYTIIEPDTLSSMPSEISDRLKMGIKMSSWSDSSFPSVDEFAMTIGASKDNLLNKVT